MFAYYKIGNDFCNPSGPGQYIVPSHKNNEIKFVNIAGFEDVIYIDTNETDVDWLSRVCKNYKLLKAYKLYRDTSKNNDLIAEDAVM